MVHRSGQRIWEVAFLICKSFKMGLMYLLVREPRASPIHSPLRYHKDKIGAAYVRCCLAV
jgi:hypothetical protein